MRQPPALYLPLSTAATAQMTAAPMATAPSEPPTQLLATATRAKRLVLTSSTGLLARVQERRPHLANPTPPMKPTEYLAIGNATANYATRRGKARSNRRRNATLTRLLVATIVMATIGTLASGTLATFNAQTSNAGNTFNTGTLVLGNQPTGKTRLTTTILSSASLASIAVERLQSTIPAGTAVTISDNASPTQHTQTLTVAAQVLPGATTITFSGSPVAANNYTTTVATINFPLSYEAVTTTTAIANGAAITTLAVTAVQSIVPTGTTLTITNGTNSQTLTTNSSVNSGATTLSTTSTSATAAYPSGSRVTWSAAGTGTATTSQITGTITSLPVNALTTAIPANAVVILTNPSLLAPNNFQAITVTAAGAANGATSIPTVSTALNNTYPAGSLVTYDYSSGALCYSTAVTSGTFNNGNANPGCGSLAFTSYGRPQGSTENAYSADLTITNQGSIAASTLTVYMQNCATTINTAETYNGTGDLCGQLEMFLQEWGDAAHTTPTHCWYGSGTATTCTNPPPDPSPKLGSFNGSATPLTLTNGLNPKGSAGDTRYFTIGLRLPAATDNTYQGRTASFDLVWTATQ